MVAIINTIIPFPSIVLYRSCKRIEDGRPSVCDTVNGNILLVILIHDRRATHDTLSLSISCRLLYSVLPPSVANELRHQRPVPPKR